MAVTIIFIFGVSFGPLTAMPRKPRRAVVINRMKGDLAIRALYMAAALHQPPKGCSYHTGRRWQYCSNDYQKRLTKNGFEVSMSAKGNCCVNSMDETLFKSLNAEPI